MSDSRAQKRQHNTAEDDDESSGGKSLRKCENCSQTQNNEELFTKISGLEVKLVRQNDSHNKVLDVLNKKMDLLVRLMSDQNEAQNKMAKSLANVAKLVEKKIEKLNPPKPTAANSMGIFLQNLQNNGSENSKEDTQNNDTVVSYTSRNYLSGCCNLNSQCDYTYIDLSTQL
jgi:hypothetical protein